MEGLILVKVLEILVEESFKNIYSVAESEGFTSPTFLQQIKHKQKTHYVRLLFALYGGE